MFVYKVHKLTFQTLTHNKVPHSLKKKIYIRNLIQLS
jgi:hypothetical protein